MKFTKEDIELFINHRNVTPKLIISRRGTLNSIDTWFDKVKLVLSIEDEALSVREILNRIHEYFDNASKENNRKNIISLSTILIEKVKEGKIIKVKNKGENARFKLPENAN